MLRTLILATYAIALGAGEPITIAFGSCIRPGVRSPALEEVVERPRDRWLFLGDNAYLDTANEQVMAEGYRTFRARPDVAALFAGPVEAIWDDHDYGLNDGGREWVAKEAARRTFCDAFALPPDDPRRTRSDGIYHATMIERDGLRVQLILLDARWNRSPLRLRSERPPAGQGPYLPATADQEQSILGEAQWQWLEGRLREPATVRVIACGIQVLAPGHGWETWANLPAEQARLWRLLRATRAAGVIMISGDRHFGELSRLPAGGSEDEPPYSIWDLTSSSLTTPAPGGRRANPLRVGSAVVSINSGEILVNPSGIVTLRLLAPGSGVALTQNVPLGELQLP